MPGQLDSRLHVRVGGRALARVVEQQREHQDLGMLDFGQQLAERPAGAPQVFRCDDGVFVHRVAMVEIADDQAFDAFHLRKNRREDARLVHPADR